MFSPREIKNKWNAINMARMGLGELPLEASLNLALLIASSALLEHKLRSGDDYMEHSLTVGFNGTESTTKKIIGILHDVVEDSEWTIEDLRDLGFSERILKGVDGVTKHKGEKYFNFIERCAQSGDDAIDIKLKDLRHNSQNTRTQTIAKTDKQEKKEDIYNISYFYLVAIKKKEIEPGASIVHFALDNYSQSRNEVLSLLKEFYEAPTSTSSAPKPKAP